jgi:hypothetical protein
VPDDAQKKADQKTDRDYMNWRSLCDPRFIITFLAVGLAGSYDVAVTFLHPAIDKELMTVILTALNTNGLVTAVNYWLGSSHSSQAKDDTIHQLTSK